MTKEEAIKILNNRNDFGIPSGYTGMYAEAFDMALAALVESGEEHRESMSDKIIVHNDKVIIEPTLYMKPQIFHDNVELILKQMESGDVTVLPLGFTAKIVRRDVVLEDQKGETDDN